MKEMIDHNIPIDNLLIANEPSETEMLSHQIGALAPLLHKIIMKTSDNKEQELLVENSGMKEDAAKNEQEGFPQTENEAQEGHEKDLIQKKERFR